jgi:rod shape-determining protein MreD
MIKNILKILIIIAVAVIQVTLMPNLNIYGVWPNLLLILALLLIFFGAEPEAYLTASLGGLILDLASPLSFGFYTLTLVSLTVFIRFLVNKFLNEPNVPVIIVILSLSILFMSILESLVAHDFHVNLIFINLIYGLFMGLIFYRVLSFWIDNQQKIKVKIR